MVELGDIGGELWEKESPLLLGSREFRVAPGLPGGHVDQLVPVQALQGEQLRPWRVKQTAARPREIQHAGAAIQELGKGNRNTSRLWQKQQYNI